MYNVDEVMTQIDELVIKGAKLYHITNGESWLNNNELTELHAWADALSYEVNRRS